MEEVQELSVPATNSKDKHIHTIRYLPKLRFRLGNYFNLLNQLV